MILTNVIKFNANPKSQIELSSLARAFRLLRKIIPKDNWGLLRIIMLSLWVIIEIRGVIATACVAKTALLLN